MAEYLAYFKGKFVPRSECKIDVGDPAFMLGDAVFDMTRCFNGKPFRLRDHLKRLFRSIDAALMEPPMSMEELEELTLELVRRNEPLRPAGEEFHITHLVPRAQTPRGAARAKSDLIITMRNIPFDAYAKYYIKGVHLVPVSVRSYPPDTVDPKMKHISRMNFCLAKQEASVIDPEGFPLLQDHYGNITESISCNLFFVKDGVVRTPPDRAILQGTSRAIVMELAANLGIDVREEDVQMYDAYGADEAFITGTSPCIMPVSRINTRPLPGPIPGPITQRLLAAYSELAGVDIQDQAISYAKAKGAL